MTYAIAPSDRDRFNTRSEQIIDFPGYRSSFMTRKIASIVFSTGLFLLLACGERVSDESAVESEERVSDESTVESEARAVARELAQGKYTELTQRFDATMTAQVPPARLADLWESVTTQCGEFQNLGQIRTQQVGEYTTVYVEMVFSEMPYWAKVIFDSERKISGLRLTPNPDEDEITELPSYIDPDKFTERAGRLGDTAWVIQGQVAVPNGPGPFPAVILFHRHGPNDRHETTGVNRPFDDLAGGLASQGIAVLRYDNRTFLHPEKIKADLKLTVQDEVIRDLRFAVDFLKVSTLIDSTRIFALGHGYGGTLLPAVGYEFDILAGFILMGAPTRPLEDVLYDEVEYIYSEDGTISASEQDALNKLESEASMVKSEELTPEVPGEYLPLGMGGYYWKQLRGYKPVKIALKIEEPMLILQGERDYHANMTDFEDWRQLVLARNNVLLRSFPGLNHLFIRGEGRSHPDEYLIPGHVDGEVIDVIARWIHEH